MEFGKVVEGDLTKIDFTLVADHEGTTRLLKQQKSKTKTNVFVG